MLCLLFHITWVALALDDLAMVCAKQCTGPQSARIRISFMTAVQAIAVAVENKMNSRTWRPET